MRVDFFPRRQNANPLSGYLEHDPNGVHCSCGRIRKNGLGVGTILVQKKRLKGECRKKGSRGSATKKKAQGGVQKRNKAQSRR
jgi:hypothetical protein